MAPFQRSEGHLQAREYTVSSNNASSPAPRDFAFPTPHLTECTKEAHDPVRCSIAMRQKHQQVDVGWRPFKGVKATCCHAIRTAFGKASSPDRVHSFERARSNVNFLASVVLAANAAPDWVHSLPAPVHSFERARSNINFLACAVSTSMKHLDRCTPLKGRDPTSTL